MAKKSTIMDIEGKSIEELEILETQKVYQKLLDSMESADSDKKNKVVLSAKVIAYQFNQNQKTPETQCSAVCFFKGWKVVIPAALMGFAKFEEGTSNENRKKAYHAYIKGMLNAEIDFFVTSISAEDKTVIGNRSAAVMYQIQKNYFNSDKDGFSKIERGFKQGKFATARVITVSRSVVWLDIYGLTTKVIAREVAWRFVKSLTDVISVGDIVNVKIKSLEIDKENKKISMNVSIKEAYPNTMKENMRNYTETSEYIGKVTGISPSAYFVQIGDLKSGIDVYCKHVLCPELPGLDDEVIVQLTFLNGEEGRAYGKIEKITKRKEL